MPARWRRIASFAEPYRPSLVALIALTLGMSALGAVGPALWGQTFDALSGPGATLAWLVAAIVGVEIVRELVGGVHNALTWKTRLAIHQDLLEATVAKLHRLPLSFHQEESVGGRMMLVDRGIQGLVNALSELALSVLPALLYLLVSVGLMWSLHPGLTLVVLVFAPLPAVVAAWAAPEQIRRERDLLERWTKIYGRFNEVLQGIVTVKSFAMEDVEKRRFLGQVSEANQRVVRGVVRDSWTGGVRNLAGVAARATALAYGGWLAWRGEITGGTVLAFSAYLGGLLGPVQGLASVYQTVRRATVSLDTVLDVLDAQDHLGDAPDAVKLDRVRGDVRFEGVRFAYDARRPILHGIDLHVRAGERVAVVGPSGSGKSTMLALLQRLYDPVEGRILVDGLDVRRVQQRSLRQNIGVVLQDGLLFDDTVRNNIAYGRPDATMEQVEAAARAAHAHEFVATLGEGYETRVGERGNRLSAGQRQRIGIARALLKDPPILVLDEATSALDAESEALVEDALEKLVRGRTTFVVAHRLSTVVRADRIVVLRHGRLIESGTHAELVAAGGFYASLVGSQTRGLLVA
jgi:ATP-binding cassette subfamily B protein